MPVFMLGKTVGLIAQAYGQYPVRFVVQIPGYTEK